MVFRNCLGMIMSVSILIIGKGAATPRSVVNFCMADIPVTLAGFMSYRPAQGQEPRDKSPGRRAGSAFRHRAEKRIIGTSPPARSLEAHDPNPGPLRHHHLRHRGAAPA